jgi:hypothetical protein
VTPVSARFAVDRAGHRNATYSPAAPPELARSTAGTRPPRGNLRVVADGLEPLEAQRSRRRTVSAFVVAGLALVTVPLVVTRMVSQPDGEVRRYEIPPGTAAALARGEPVDVLPADLRLRLRDTLVVVNLDATAHQVGPFRLGPGEQLSRHGDELGSFSGFCSLHPGGRLDIEVERPKG